VILTTPVLVTDIKELGNGAHMPPDPDTAY
jgi:hypothetical protein